MEQKYKLSAAAKYLGYNKIYLQALDRKGILPARRTETNQRYYLKSDLDAFLHAPDVDNENRTIVAYCRVSSPAQKPDLKNQRNVIEEYCVAKGYSNVEYITEIGGGLNFKRKQFCRLITDIMHQKISILVVAHKDRLCRFGFDLVQFIAAQSGTKIEVLNTEKMSPEKELVTDLMTIIHCFSSRLYGLRNYRKSLNKALKSEIANNTEK